MHAEVNAKRQSGRRTSVRATVPNGPMTEKCMGRRNVWRFNSKIIVVLNDRGRDGLDKERNRNDERIERFMEKKLDMER